MMYYWGLNINLACVLVPIKMNFGTMKGTVSIVVQHIFLTFSVEVIVSSVVAKLSLNDSKMLLCCFVRLFSTC